MATKKNNSNNNADQNKSGGNSNNLKFLINAQYLKDLSFENPKAPNSLRQLSNESSPKFQITYVHQRYGDFVLFSPPVRLDTIALWLTPLLFIFILFFIFFRKR